MTRAGGFVRWLVAALSLAAAGAVLLRLAGQQLSVAWFRRELLLLAPERLGLLALIPLLIALAGWRRRGAGDGLLSALSLLSLTACATCLVLALCRPELQGSRQPIELVALVDRSASISSAARARAQTFLGELESARGRNVLRVIDFSDGPEQQRQTDLQAAVQATYAELSPGYEARIVLLTDGGQTRGDLELEAERAGALGVAIDHFDLAPSAGAGEPEVLVEAVELPRELAPGVPLSLRVRVRATRATRARLELFREPEPVALSSRTLELPLGASELEFETSVKLPGRVEYRVELTPEGPDRFRENNRASAAAIVPGPPRVLVIDSEPAQIGALAHALRTRDFAVDVRPPAGLPREREALAQYDFVLLSDVPARDLRGQSMPLLREYAQDGGGLMMAGGANGFGLGGYQGTLLEELMPVRMAGEEWQEQPSLALALIIDCSGSMAGDKLALARQAATLTAQALADADLIEVIGFTSEPERRVRLQRAGNRASIAQSIARLAASGGTQLYPALDAAHRDLRGARVRLKHAILLTDGQTQETGVEELAIAMHADGITLSTVGLGVEVNRGLLETLAGLGGGRAYITQDARNVPQIFVSEATRQKQASAVTRSARVFVEERASFLDGVPVELAPPLGGFVGTQAKPRPAQVILRSEEGAPLLARWRVGLGYALAWTSDLKPRWSTAWLGWPNFDRFIAQLVREHMRAAPERELPIEARVEQDQLHAAVDALGPDDRFWNGLGGELRVFDRSGQVRTAAFEQRAPGRYEASSGLAGFGAFTLDSQLGSALEPGASDERVVHARGSIAHPYANEFVPDRVDPRLLTRVAAATGGRALTRAVDAFEARAPQRRLPREPQWPRLAWWALGLFLVHEGVRKLRLFGRTSGLDRGGG